MYSYENCKRGMYDETESGDNIGCIAIIKPEWFKESARIEENQLFRIEGGFGAYPDKMGNAVFGTFCVDGEHTRIEKYDFLGIAKDEIAAKGVAMEAMREQNN